MPHDYLIPEQRLANAVIIQAAKDYRIALCTGNKSRIMELEKFFQSQRFTIFTNINGPMLMKRLYNEVEELNFNAKKVYNLHMQIVNKRMSDHYKSF